MHAGLKSKSWFLKVKSHESLLGKRMNGPYLHVLRVLRLKAQLKGQFNRFAIIKTIARGYSRPSLSYRGFILFSDGLASWHISLVAE